MDHPNRPPRYPTYIPVVVTKSGTAQTGYIVDINAYGACVAGVENIKEDETIHLRGAVETNIANVRWDTGGRVGVFFERPIQPLNLAMLRLRGASQQVLDGEFRVS